MKKIFLPFLFISLVFASIAQTVDEVIDKHTEAMGGKEKIVFPEISIHGNRFGDAKW